MINFSVIYLVVQSCHEIDDDSSYLFIELSLISVYLGRHIVIR